MQFILKTTEVTLSDGSKVYDVMLLQQQARKPLAPATGAATKTVNVATFSAVTWSDADKFAHELADLINEHTVHLAEVLS